MAQPVPTRQRLLAAGMALFAERGFAATSVADIERAVGLQPRRGGLYKHFESKHDLLASAVREHLAVGEATAAELGQIDVGAADLSRADLRELVLLIGRRFLDEMDRLEELTRVLEHDGVRLGDLVQEVKDRAVDLSYVAAERLVAAAGPPGIDARATAVVLLGSLVALRRTTWTFGSPPVGIDDTRFLEAWADVTLALAPLP